MTFFGPLDATVLVTKNEYGSHMNLTSPLFSSELPATKLDVLEAKQELRGAFHSELSETRVRLLGKINVLEKKVNALEKKVNALEKRVKALEKKLDVLQQKVDMLQMQMQEIHQQLQGVVENTTLILNAVATKFDDHDRRLVRLEKSKSLLL